jgi:hypothetical protein
VHPLSLPAARLYFGGPQYSVPPHPSGTVPTSPTHVIGWQQVPSEVHTSPVAHVRHVTFAPHPSLTGRHDGFFTVEQSSFAQHVFEMHVSFDPLHCPHCSVFPHPSDIESQLFGPQVFGVQHAPVLSQTSLPGHTFPVQSTVVFMHGSSFFPQSFGPHVTGVQHWFSSGPPATPHDSFAAQLFEQLNTVPLHGSV